MGLYQSYQTVFVTNSPSLLASGQTVDSLGVGQIGIMDPKTNTATTTPTYAKNKALKLVWGTPNVNAGEFAGVPNENEYTKLIKGKKILSFRSKAAVHPHTPVYTVGWSGDVADTNTLFANPGEGKSLFIKLTGTIIERLYSPQGVVKEFVITPACLNACTDSCGTTDCTLIAADLVNQINGDKDFSKFIKAKSLVTCNPSTSPTVTNCYQFTLSICDTGDDAALGIVQAEYSGFTITRQSRVGSTSTYLVTLQVNTAPSAFTSQNVFIADCPTCPTGYTFTASANVFQVTIPAGGSAPSGLPGQIAASLISAGPQFSVYYVTTATTQSQSAFIAAAVTAGYSAVFIGVKSQVCQQTSATTTSWVAGNVLNQQTATYIITLADSLCGTNRLAELQAAYPALTISVVNSAGSCVHSYTTTVNSNCYLPGCAIDQITFTAPNVYQGAEWILTPAAVAAGTTCLCGIQLETAFFNVQTNECTFDAFPYENDIVHIQISNYNPDYNADPCIGQWAVKQIRQVQYPQGNGQYIQHREQESKAYDKRTRSWDPVVRQVQGYSLQADATKYYDEYVLEYEVDFYTSGGWAEKYSETFSLCLYVPEGQGSAIENAINSYLTSAGIEENGTAII